MPEGELQVEIRVRAGCRRTTEIKGGWSKSCDLSVILYLFLSLE